ncbi:MAG TPA: GNAT family N-acetyltransferase [Myxococcota bacterium]|nr:GNAT family N-acetyltransferase [Myxococcota bacterium]
MVTLRRATSDDVDVVAALFGALLAHHGPLDPALRVRANAGAEIRELVRAMLRDPDAAWWLAWPDGAAAGDAPAGLCGARVDAAPPILEETLRGEISDLYVAPDVRRRGMGRALTEAALAWLDARGARRVEVRVSPRNEAGRAFWRALGFAPFMDVLDRRR